MDPQRGEPATVMNGGDGPLAFREMLRRILAGEVDDLSAAQRDECAERLVRAASESAAVVALQPVPFLDTVLLTPIQLGMVQGTARIRGYHFDERAALDLLGTFRISVATRHLVLAGAKLIPTLGYVLSVPLAYALTYALGEAADCYFVRGRSMVPEQMRDTYHRVYEETLKNMYAKKRRQMRAFFARLHLAAAAKTKEPDGAGDATKCTSPGARRSIQGVASRKPN
jgi:uncharacterized protein (DUF697 family)